MGDIAPPLKIRKRLPLPPFKLHPGSQPSPPLHAASFPAWFRAQGMWGKGVQMPEGAQSPSLLPQNPAFPFLGLITARARETPAFRLLSPCPGPE